MRIKSFFSFLILFLLTKTVYCQGTISGNSTRIPLSQDGASIKPGNVYVNNTLYRSYKPYSPDLASNSIAVQKNSDNFVKIDVRPVVDFGDWECTDDYYMDISSNNANDVNLSASSIRLSDESVVTSNELSDRGIIGADGFVTASKLMSALIKVEPDFYGVLDLTLWRGIRVYYYNNDFDKGCRNNNSTEVLVTDNVCVLASPNQSPGKPYIEDAYGTNPEADVFFADASGTAKVYFKLDDDGYCGDLDQIKFYLNGYQSVALMSKGFGSYVTKDPGDYSVDVQYVRGNLGNGQYIYHTGTYEIPNFTVYPACARMEDLGILTGDDLNNIIHVLDANGNVVDRTQPLEPNTSYWLASESNKTDLLYNYYNVVSNRPNDVSFTSTKQVMGNYTTFGSFSIANPLGKFTLEMQRVDDVSYIDQCAPTTSIKLFTGGSDEIHVEANCLVVLPEDLSTVFELPYYEDGDVLSDYMLQHFQYTVISSKGIVVTDGVTLENGAVLEVDRTLFEQEGLEDHRLTDLDRNWEQVITYDDAGRVIGESRTYFDELARPTQSQYKNLEENIVLATETVYDGENRPALQTLNAPVYEEVNESVSNCAEERIQIGDRMLFEYSEEFLSVNDNNASNKLNASHLYASNASTAPLPKALNTQEGTLGWYYSNNNSKSTASKFAEPYTPATDYPFAQTVFYTDGSKEVKSTVSPGDVYRNTDGTFAYTAERETNPDFGPFINFAEDIMDSYQTFYNVLYKGVPDHTYTFDKDEDYYFENVRDPDNRNLFGSFSAVNREGQVLVSFASKGYGINNVLLNCVVSANFYDAKGRVVMSVTPNAWHELFQEETSNHHLLQNLKNEYNPFENDYSKDYLDLDITRYEYNHRGEVVRVHEKDAGTTEYLYSIDGLLRFSRNQLQAENNRYSYTHYDELGRVVESGEYDVSVSGIAFDAITQSQLDEFSNFSFYGQTSNDYQIILYDWSFSSSPIEQTFVRGGVSRTEGENSVTWYSYDSRNRVKAAAQVIKGFNTVTGGNTTFICEYKYDDAGNVQQIYFKSGVSSQDNFYHVYLYDKNQNLKEVYTSTTEPDWGNPDEGQDSKKLQSKDGLNLMASYEYYKHGPLKRVELGDAHNGKPLQGMDYVYTIEGWLKSINHPSTSDDPGSDFSNSAEEDVFGIMFRYYDGDYNKYNVRAHNIEIGNEPDLHNGNIVSQAWSTQTSSTSSTREIYQTEFGYDEFSQLKWSHFTSLNRIQSGELVVDASEDMGYTIQNLYYDYNGNILSLTRSNKNGLVQHNFYDDNNYGYYQYEANSNKLTLVPDYKSFNYNSIGQTETAIGNLTSQPQYRKYFSYSYNASGKISDIDISQSGYTYEHDYIYDENGAKIASASYDSHNPSLTQRQWYINDPVSGVTMATYYTPFEDVVSPTLQDRMVYGGGGRIGMLSENTGNYEFEIKDHLGSVRAVIQEQGTAGTFAITHWADYYPYGLKSENYDNGGAYRYGYQGEYAEDEVPKVGLNMFDLRGYDPVIGRWISVDPERQYASPYMAMGNNPVMSVDPDGGKDIIYLENGKEVKRINTDDSYDIVISTWAIEGFTPFTNVAVYDKIFYSPEDLSQEQRIEQLDYYLDLFPSPGNIDPDYTIESMLFPMPKGGGKATNVLYSSSKANKTFKTLKTAFRYAKAFNKIPKNMNGTKSVTYDKYTKKELSTWTFKVGKDKFVIRQDIATTHWKGNSSSQFPHFNVSKNGNDLGQHWTFLSK